METKDNNYAENINNYLLIRGMSQADLARALGVSRSCVSRICSGVNVPSAQTIRKIADVFGVPVDALLVEKSAYTAELSAKDVGERIADALNERGMTQVQLAEKTKLTEATISRFVTGQRFPTALNLSKIALALGYDYDYLLTGKEKDTKQEIKELMRLIKRNVKNMSREQKIDIIEALYA